MITFSMRALCVMSLIMAVSMHLEGAMEMPRQKRDIRPNYQIDLDNIKMLQSWSQDIKNRVNEPDFVLAEHSENIDNLVGFLKYAADGQYFITCSLPEDLEKDLVYFNSLLQSSAADLSGLHGEVKSDEMISS